MIEILNGIKETVVYKNRTGFSLRWNDDTEVFPPHWHMAYEILMPVENTYQVTVDKRTYTLQPNDVFLINAGEIHSLLPPETGKRLIFLCDQQILYAVNGLDTALHMLPPASLFTPDSADYQEINRRLQTIAKTIECPDQFTEATVYAQLILLFVLFCQKVSGENTGTGNCIGREHTEKLLQACDYIHANYSEKLTLKMVAHQAGFSKFYFSRLFKDFTRLTFTDYLTKTRVEQAKYLLTDSKLSILDIALQTGFSSLSSFNRCFKQLNNCAPSSFRNRILQ